MEQPWPLHHQHPHLHPHPHQLQLEHEYDMDPTQFQMLQPEGDQRYAARQAHSPDPAAAGYAPFPAQSYAPAPSPVPAGYVSPQMGSQYANGPLYLGGDAGALHRTQSQTYGSVPAALQPSPPAMQQAFYHTHGDAQGFAYGPQQGAGAVSQGPSPSVSPTFPSFQLREGQQTYGPVLSAGQAYGTVAGPSSDMHANAAYGHFADMAQPYQLAPGGPSLAKRQRGLEESMWEDDGEGNWDDGLQRGEEHKPKPIGACARCKGLKVRCEFIGDSDTCKRCTSGRHDCVIPGRKKRKPPPKREHLLNQIRDQAAQISELMSKLEEANHKAGRRASGAAAPLLPAAIKHEPGSASDLAPEPDIGTPLPQSTRAASAEVEDWITKARQSIEAFGGFISMGGPSVTMDMLGDGGSGESAPASDDEGEYELYVEDVDAEDGIGAAAGDAESLFGEEPRGAFSRESTEVPAPTRRGHGKLASVPNESVPFGLFRELAITKRRRRRPSQSVSEVGEDDASDVGLANDDYFRPSPAPERPIVDERQQPAILRNGIITPAEAEKLFGIYYDYMNLSLSLLDPVLYTAQKTYWRSPFLFTVICAIASRYYAPRPELYEQAMKYARLAAGTALIGGQKTIEVVQAYILLSLYPVPARRWEDDRSFIYLGLAIRVATDLKLHYAINTKPENEHHAREILNRTRVWLNCFNLDRSTGSQYGQRPIIDNNDYVANHTEFWWNSSPYNMDGFDVHTCCYNAELKVMGEFRMRIYSNPNHPTGLNKEVDLAKIASETDDRLARLWETWIPRVREANTGDQQSHFRTGLLKLAFSYARLSVLSVGFQYSFGKAAATDEEPFLWRCLRAATDTVKAVVEDIAIPTQKIYLRHGPEAQCVFVTFASAFLVKLLQPKYAQHLSRERRVEIRDLVQRVIDLLSSPEVAIDDRHGPKLYARFLQGLLATPMARVDQSPASVRSPRRVPSKQSSARSSPSQAPGTLSARQSLSPPPATSSAASSPKPDTPPPPSALLQLQQAQIAAGAPQYAAQPTATSDLDIPGFFSPPLFYDSELLQSMQSITDWPDMVLPGFNWMGSMQQTDFNTNIRYDQPMVGFTHSG